MMYLMVGVNPHGLSRLLLDLTLKKLVFSTSKLGSPLLGSWTLESSILECFPCCLCWKSELNTVPGPLLTGELPWTVLVDNRAAQLLMLRSNEAS